MKNSILEAKTLASSITSALNVLYKFNVMQSTNTPEDNGLSDDTLFVILAASERLSEMMEVIA